MAEICLAKTAGFCFGVSRAVDSVYEQIQQGGRIYTFGPIIHNEEVVKDLSGKGVQVIEDLEKISALKEGTIIIRSHGVAKDVYEKIAANANLQVVDCTCPFVKRIHNIVQKESLEGRKIVIIGDAGHPEVEGIKGWCEGSSYIVGSAEEVEKIELSEKNRISIVAQTTYNENKFQELVDIFQKKGYDTNVVNTICNATHDRQTEAIEIAKAVDTMIVIGGASSSNTKKLYEICKKECQDTYFVQTVDDLKRVFKGDARKIGITAGASTPKNIIEEVQSYVRRNDI